MARPFARSIPGFSPSLFAAREVLFPLAAFLVAITFPYRSIFLAFIAIGQAHFLITYIYQYKARRMRRGYLIAAAILAAGSIAYFALGYGIVPILLFTAGIFGFHLAIDEITLHGDRVRVPQAVIIAAYALVFFGAQVLAVFPQHRALILPLAVAFIGLIVIRACIGRTAFTTGEGYLVFLAVLMLIAAGLFQVPAAIIGMAIMLHYANWYVGYGVRVEDKPERGREYWFHVGWTVLLSCGVLALYLGGFAASGVFFFEPAHFYAWTTAHVVLSFITAFPKRA